MIYFIQVVNGGHIKIGYTADVQKRLEILQVGNPHELRVIGTIEGDMKVEFRLHKKFEEYRYRNEWFEPSEELLDFINNLCTFDTKSLFANEERSEAMFKPPFSIVTFFRDMKQEMENRESDKAVALQYLERCFRTALREYGYAADIIDGLVKVFASSIEDCANQVREPKRTPAKPEPVYTDEMHIREMAKLGL